MSSVLVLASSIVDQLDSITDLAWRKALRWRPRSVTFVWHTLRDSVLRHSILSWTLQQHERDGALGSRGPGDGVWDADRNDIVQTRSEERVADWSITGWPEGSKSQLIGFVRAWCRACVLGVARGERHKKGKAGREKAEQREVGHLDAFIGCVVLDLVWVEGLRMLDRNENGVINGY